jgi:thiamine pyrophosphokinase
LSLQTLIICNGEPPSRRLARKLARDAEMVIAADGGANIARRYGIRPDVIIGDLDSIQPATRKVFRSTTIMQISRQDNTDLEKALDYVLTQKLDEVSVIAATGKRLDFTLGNLSVIWNYAHTLRMTFLGDGWMASPVGRSRTIKAPIGTIVSLIPFGRCSGVTLRGLRYPLVNATMNVGGIGVSNVVRSSPFSVHVRKGNMLLIVLEKHRRSPGKQ